MENCIDLKSLQCPAISGRLQDSSHFEVVDRKLENENASLHITSEITFEAVLSVLTKDVLKIQWNTKILTQRVAAKDNCHKKVQENTFKVPDLQGGR